MLRDLEETLLSIQDRESREFMREAVRCYHAGAFRAAIVMAMAAAMDDLRRKLMEQAATGGAPAVIKTTATQIDQLFQAEQAFEGTLIDLCQKDATVFTTAEAAKMRLLLKLRHLCAHPSGHVATPEEAREAITSAIDLVLARPALLGMVAVTSLLDRLEGQLFFPNFANTLPTVQAELGRLQPALYRALAKKLVDKVLENAKLDTAMPARLITTPRPTIRENGVAFLMGMLTIGGKARDAVWNYFGTLLESFEADLDALRILTADPNGIAANGPLTRDRSVALARRRIAQSESRFLIRYWVGAGVLSEQERIEIEAIARSTLLRKVDSNTHQAISELGWPSLMKSLVEKLADDAGSGDFTTSNDAISAMQTLPQEIAGLTTVDQRLAYVLGVATSSHGSEFYGREARRVVTQGLGARTDYLDALRTVAIENPGRLRDSKVPWLQLARLVRASGRPDVLADVLAVFKGHEGQHYYTIKEMLQELISDPTLSVTAASILETGKTAAKAMLQFPSP